MVCDNCKKKQFFNKEGLVCFNCNKTRLLSYEDSLKLVELLIGTADLFFKEELKKFEKDNLLMFLLDYRDKLIYKMFFEVYCVEQEKFLAVNLLIKRVMQSTDFINKEKAEKERVSKLIEAFTFWTSTKSWYYHIKDKFAIFSYEKSLDFKNINPHMLFTNPHLFSEVCKNYKIHHAEEFEYIFDTFYLNQNLSKAEAEKYLNEHNEEYKKIEKESENKEKVHYTTEQYIEKFYDFIIAIYSILLRNQVYVDMFNLEYLEKTSIKPENIIKLRNKFSHREDILCAAKIEDFDRMISQLGYNKDEYYNNLVFSEENQSIFPFFVKVRTTIINSFWCNYFMAMFSNMFLEKETFLKIHDRRSKKFEKEDCKKEFRNLGYRCWIDQKDTEKKTNLQIDLLAWKENQLFVAEIKIWGIKEYFEQKKVHEQRERDLKGVVDGIEYTKEEPTKRPSLLNKVEYVKQNLNKWGLEKVKDLNIRGLVITKSVPPKKDYKGVKFISVTQIKEL